MPVYVDIYLLFGGNNPTLGEGTTILPRFPQVASLSKSNEEVWLLQAQVIFYNPWEHGFTFFKHGMKKKITLNY